MLTSFSLRVFESFRQDSLPLGPPTVLIGANAAGKSNASEARRLQSWLAKAFRGELVPQDPNDEPAGAAAGQAERSFVGRAEVREGEQAAGQAVAARCHRERGFRHRAELAACPEKSEVCRELAETTPRGRRDDSGRSRPNATLLPAKRDSRFHTEATA
jgi:hypothetical protein